MDRQVLHRIAATLMLRSTRGKFAVVVLCYSLAAGAATVALVTMAVTYASSL